MPEQETDVQEALQGMAGKDWLSREEYYVCRVELGASDHVELLAVTGRITEHLEELVGLVSQVATDNDDDTTTIQALQKALQGDLPDKVWKQLDQLLTEHIRDWDLSKYAEKHGLKRPPNPPGEIEDADEREQMLKDLPVPLLGRIIYGLAWHSGNF